MFDVTKLPSTVSELIEHNGQQFYDWQADKLDTQNLILSGDTERLDRILAASENGSDGSLHWEHIDDFREYGSELYSQAEKDLWNADLEQEEYDTLLAQLEERKEALEQDLVHLEQWHIANGSYEQEIG